MPEQLSDQSRQPVDPIDIIPDEEVFSGQPISKKDLNAWAKSKGFTHGRAGIYWDAEERPDSENFLSVKGCHRFGNIEPAVEGLALLRELTERGVFYPATRWGMVNDNDGTYQLFAMTPKLESEPSYSPTGQREEYETVTINLDGQNRSEWTRLLDLYQRIDPNFDRTNGPEPTSITSLVNHTEASQGYNWGWAEDGQAYPIDTEVIHLSGAREEAILHNWYQAQQGVA
jgi:hypothetical protein